ncbi:putative Xre family DNA-binding protein [Gordonia effusa NBRC 100432]|uniref:Putative Xre family DNA-binding protein n=1 Tax=Gordonia effusa NBRC 100432 TaxID=1077974 RepID=H0QZR7_9ACTN|nr:helix-turn-helix transcriptional regulator [Gordonia effusa]GAB18318.1 putative Xre family DNA-binding protein [Gordonia effusa NBRC 100432]
MSSDESQRFGPESMSRSVLRGFDPARFETARTEKGLSRSDLARMAKIKTVETIRRWEKGLAAPQIDVLGRAITCLGVAPDSVILTEPAERYLSDWRHLTLQTQPELAASAGLSTNLVAQLELGLGTLTDDRAERLATALGITSEEVRSSYERVRARPAGTPA